MYRSSKATVLVIVCSDCRLKLGQRFLGDWKKIV